MHNNKNASWTFFLSVGMLNGDMQNTIFYTVFSLKAIRFVSDDISRFNAENTIDGHIGHKKKTQTKTTKCIFRA